MVIEIWLFCHVISQDHVIKDHVTLRMKAPPGKSQFCMFNGHRHCGSGYNMSYSHNFKWLLSFWSLWLTVGKSIIKITSLTIFFCQMIQNRKAWWKKLLFTSIKSRKWKSSNYFQQKSKSISTFRWLTFLVISKAKLNRTFDIFRFQRVIERN